MGNKTDHNPTHKNECLICLPRILAVLRGLVSCCKTYNRSPVTADHSDRSDLGSVAVNEPFDTRNETGVIRRQKQCSRNILGFPLRRVGCFRFNLIKKEVQLEHGKIKIEIIGFCVNFWGRSRLNQRKRNRFLYRFCTADSAFEPFWVFLLFGESITYMLSTLLHSSIPTSSTKF